MSLFKSSFSKTGYFGQHCGYLFLKAIFSFFPTQLMMKNADVIGKLFFSGLRIRRDVTIANLRYALGDDYKGLPVEVLAQHVYAHLFRTCLELFNIQKMLVHMGEYVHIRHLERFKQALQGGRGAILVTGHFGNFELGALALAWAGIPVSVVAKPLRNPFIDREITRLRQSLGAEIIPVNDAGRRVFGALRRNRVVCLLSDQDAGKRRGGIMVRFFGHPTSTTTAPARLALQTHAPLLPSFICRQANGAHLLEIGHPIEMKYSKESRQEEIHRVTQEISLELEKWVSCHPEQYFWLHRRWKSTPAGKRLYFLKK